MNEQIEAAIKEFAGPEGFWKSDAEDVLRDVFTRLTQNGIPLGMAQEIVGSVWSTCREEYGD